MTAGPIVRANTAADGTQADRQSTNPSLSADGGHVAFQSGAGNLVPGIDDGSRIIFVKDLATGAIDAASIAADGTQGNLGSRLPSLSADASHVAFWSQANNLLPGATTGGWNLFVKELDTGAIVLANTDADGTRVGGSFFIAPSIAADGRHVSFDGGSRIYAKDLDTRALVLANTTADGTLGNDRGGVPDISADGRSVAFESSADNLVPGDTNGRQDIFVKDLDTGAIVRASVAADGTQTNAWSFNASLSADGGSVAFQTRATTLVPDDTNGRTDIFVKDLDTGAVARASTASDGTQANRDATSATLSNDGRFVAFESRADNLVPGDTSARMDVFVKNLETGDIVRVSTAANGTQGNGDSYAPSLSPNGSSISFVSAASNLVPGDTNGAEDVFVKDLSDVWGVSLTGTPGNDDLSGTKNNDTISGIGGNDTLAGLNGNDNLFGNGNDDVLRGGDGFDRLDGGGGNDLLEGVSAANGVRLSFVSEDAGYRNTYGTYNTETGEARILVANVDTVTNPGLATFSTTLNVNADELDRLGFFLIPNGFTLNAGSGEPLAGGDPTALDLEVFDDGGAWKIRDMGSGHVFEGAGNPAYFTEASRNPGGRECVLEEGDLLANGVVVQNWEDLPGLGDKDFDDVTFRLSLTGAYGGNDVLEGGAGNDTVSYQGTTQGLIADLAAGVAGGPGIGRDTLSGIENLIGGRGDDTLKGDRFDNRLDAGDGDDSLSSNDGNDTYIGGAGNDTLGFEGTGSGVVVDLSAGTAMGPEIGEDAIDGIENVIGGAGDDRLVGDGENNVLIAGNGDDVLDGDDGDDLLQAGNGNDSLDGGDGKDTIESGDGNDTLAAGAGDDTVEAGDGDDSVVGGPGNETLVGGAGNDTLSFETDIVGVTVDLAAGTAYGNESGIDAFEGFENAGGGSGNDTLSGDTGRNRLEGGDGKDILRGRIGDDTLAGGAGDDTLIGGDGRDSLSGGGGNDMFDFHAVWESPPNPGRDVIEDFESPGAAAGDRIDVSDIAAFAFVGTGGFTGSGAEVRVSQDGADTRVAGDFNGDGVVDFEIQVNGTAADDFTADDFVLA